MERVADSESGDGNPDDKNSGGDAGSGDGASLPLADPATGAEPAKPRRGRPPGSKTRAGGNQAPSSQGVEKSASVAAKVPPKVAERISGSVIEKILLGIHTGVMAMTKNPMHAITPAEAAELAKAIQDVNAFYDSAPFNPKTLAWVNLCAVAGGVYGPMVLMMAMSRKEKPREPQAGQVNTPARSPAPPTQNKPSEVLDHLMQGIGGPRE